MRFLIRYLVSLVMRLRWRVAGLLPLSGEQRLRIAGLAPIAGGAANECLPYYDEGEAITANCTANVTGKTCVSISGNMTSGPGLSNTGEGGVPQVATATAAGRIFGVASHDQVTGKLVTVLRASKLVLPITAGGAIAAFAEVEVGAGGKVVTKAAGVAIGYALTAATNNNDAMISLY